MPTGERATSGRGQVLSQPTPRAALETGRTSPAMVLRLLRLLGFKLFMQYCSIFCMQNRCR